MPFENASGAEVLQNGIDFPFIQVGVIHEIRLGSRTTMTFQAIHYTIGMMFPDLMARTFANPPDESAFARKGFVFGRLE